MKNLSILITILIVLSVFITQVYSISYPKSQVGNFANDIHHVFSEIKDSAELNYPPVVSGKVFQEDNMSPSVNTELYLFAWPNVDDLIALKEGDSFSRIPIGKATTDKDGIFAICIDRNVNLIKSWSNSGSLDCELLSISDTEFCSTSFSVIKRSDKVIDRSDFSDIAFADYQGDIYQGIYTDIVLRQKPSGYNNILYTPGEYLIEVYPAQWVNVGNILLIGNSGYYTEQFIYESGATSSIGVAISTTGNFGSYTPSGSISRSSTATIGFPTYSSVTTRFMDTKFTFAKFRCNFGPIWYYCFRAHQFAGGTQTSRVCEYPADQTYRTEYLPGTFFTKQTNSAKTWSNGAKVSFLIGIDLSARCGYASNAKLYFTFNTTGYLYGEYGYPPVTNGRVWVKSW